MASEGGERRLAAMLNADVVGYSRLMSEDEAATIRSLTDYREEIAMLVRQHRGRVVDAPDDNLLAEFPTALDAVRSAVEIQRVIGVRNADLPTERRMQFRIGVHLGDVAVAGERIYGDGVNIAARLEGLAEPGGICLSGEIHGQVESKVDLRFEDLGEQSVKNIPKPVRVFRVGMEAETARPETPPKSLRRAMWTGAVVVLLGAIAVSIWRASVERSVESTAARTSAPIRSIAVLPLDNLSADPEQDHVADGMTEELIGELAKLRSLSVISRTSVMRYKQSPKSIPEIAAELGVDGVLEGTVIREAGRIRVTVQLIDARSDTHLWADRFDREVSSVLALRSDVARAVAEQIRLELTPEERATLSASRTVDPRAYDAYWRGLQLRGPGGLARAWGPQVIEHFERAVELDPEFAEAYAAQAEARVWLGSAGLDLRLRDQFPKAREAAQKALELDDRIGSAHSSLSAARFFYDWDFSGADRSCDRAVQLSPSDPYVLNNCAWYLMAMRRSKEALELMDRLLRVAPLDPFYRRRRPTNFHFDRQYERALEEFKRVWEEDPSFVDDGLGPTYYALGRFEDAYRAFVASGEQCGTPCDWTREAWERGYRERDPLMVSLRIQPFSDAVRSDPRFQDLLRRMGFPED